MAGQLGAAEKVAWRPSPEAELAKVAGIGNIVWPCPQAFVVVVVEKKKSDVQDRNPVPFLRWPLSHNK